MPKNKKKINHPPAKEKTAVPAAQNKSWIFAIFFGMLAFLLYANTLNHGYVLDDFSVLRENTIVMQGTEAIPTIFKTSYRYGYMNLDDGLYRPLSLAMFATEWQISPDNPALSHWANVLLYALSCMLLFFVLQKLFHKYSIAIAVLATLFFTAHPLHTEVVANIKSRDEILSLLLILISLHFLLKAENTKAALYSALSGVFFFIALLSKESGITMLAGFPLLLWAFSERRISKIAISMLPHILASVVFLFIRYHVLEGKLTDNTLSPLDNFLLQSKDVSVQFATAVKVLGLYLKLFLLPHPLLYDYSLSKIPLASLTDTGFLLSMIIHSALLIFALIKLQTKNVFAVFILLYFISISLFSNVFLKIGVGMAERLMYFPSMAVSVLVAFGLLKLFKERFSSNKNLLNNPTQIFSTHKLSLLTMVAIAFFFSIKTIARNPDWKDNMTLYTKDLEHLQASTRAHYYLGNEIVKNIAPNEVNTEKQKALFQQGIKELQAALKIYPSYSEALSQLAVAYYKTADYPNAVKYSESALKLNPNDIITINNLGSSLFQIGKPEEAMVYYQKAIQLNPRYEDGWMNIGSINGMMQKYDEAIDAFNNALAINPKNARAYYFISVTYRNMGNEKSANEFLQKAKMLDPSLQ